MKVCSITILIVFLFLFAAFVWLNHSCFVQSDPSIYLSFARSLARGDYFIDYPPEKLLIETLPRENYYRTLYGHIIKEGQSFSMVAIGYPLFLSLFIRWGGTFGPFFANGLVFIGLFASLYFFTEKLFNNKPHHRLISISSVLLYFLLNQQHIAYLLRTYRDPLSYMFMLLGLWVFFKFINSGKKIILMIPAGLFIGLACTARETSFLCVLPMMLIYSVKSIREKSFHLIKPGLLFLIFFIIGCSPLLLQNYINTGNPLLHTQNMVRRGLTVPDEQQTESGLSGFLVPGSKLEYFQKTSLSHVKKLWDKYGIVFIAFFLAGVYYGRKQDAVVFFLVPFIIIYVLFYSFLGKSPWRYIFVIHMAVVPLIAYGMLRLVKTVLKPEEKYLKYGLIILLLFTAYRMLGQTPRKPFQTKQAAAFAEKFDRVVPKNSVVLAERTLRSNIDYLTKSYCLRLSDVLRPAAAITTNRAIEYYMDKFGGVYFFDNIDLGLYRKFNYTPVTRQMILDHFDLTHVKSFKASTYNLERLFGKEECSLWKIMRWKQNRSRQTIEIRRIEDSVLTVNARKLWNNGFERSYVELYFNDHLLSDSISDGINFISLPKELITSSKSVIELKSDAPVPTDLEPRIVSIYDDILIDIGAGAVPLDENVVSRAAPSSRPQYRNITRQSVIHLPAFYYPDSFLIITATAWLPKQAPADCILTLFIDGEQIGINKIERSGKPQSFEFLAPFANSDGNYSRLSFDMELVDDAGQKLLDQKLPAQFLLLDSIVLKDIGADDELYIKSGLHRPEKYLGKHTIRWTENNAVFRLPQLSAHQRYSLQINVWGCPEAAGEKVSAVFLNRHRLGQMKIAPETYQTFSFDIPSEILTTTLNELKIETPTWRPRYITDPSDKRRLGIMLDSITLNAQREPR